MADYSCIGAGHAGIGIGGHFGGRAGRGDASNAVVPRCADRAVVHGANFGARLLALGWLRFGWLCAGAGAGGGEQKQKPDFFHNSYSCYIHLPFRLAGFPEISLY